MMMQRLSRCAHVIVLALLSSVLLNAQSSPMRVEMAARPAQVRPMAPELTQRYASLHQALQPSARSWVEQQARSEASNPHPDLAALENQVRARFAASLSSGEPPSSRTAAVPSMPASQIGAGQDVQAMVFIVLMEATNNADQDLQQIMSEAKAINNAKDRLRALSERAAREAAAANATKAKQPCRSQFCQSLPGEFREISASIAQSRHPVRLSIPENLTNGQLQGVASQINQQLNAESDLSQQMQLQLQMAMDQRSKFEEMASNVMKKMQDTSNAIVSNMK